MASFTVREFDRLSNIFDNAGQVFLGVMVLTPVISGIDKADYAIVLLGGVTMLACWLLSFWLTKKGEGHNV